MIGAFSDYMANSWMAQLQADPGWVGLGYEMPLGSYEGLSEITGGGYARQPVTWTAVPRGLFNAGDLRWTGLPSTPGFTVLGFDAATAGNLLYSVTLSDPWYFSQGGGSFVIQAGSLVIGLDISI